MRVKNKNSGIYSSGFYIYSQRSNCIAQVISSKSDLTPHVACISCYRPIPNFLRKIVLIYRVHKKSKLNFESNLIDKNNY